MKCSKCNSNREEIVGTVSFKSHLIGTVSVPNIRYFKCVNCDCVAYPPGEGQKIFDYVKDYEKNVKAKN